MRKAFKRQRSIGSIDIGQVRLDEKCRHEIIPILKGLQWIYSHPELLKMIVNLIENDTIGDKSKRHGAPGLDYWEILVLASIRHGCDLDYDALQDLANNHIKLRQMLGLGQMDIKRYTRSTLQQNIAKISDETIEKISQLIVDEGHRLCPEAIEKVRGDSFVTKTDIHHPTEANLIIDGVRKMMDWAVKLAALLSIFSWSQQGDYWTRAKKINRKIQRVAASKKSNRDEKLQGLHSELIELALQVTIKYEDAISEAKQRVKKNLSIDSLLVSSFILELEKHITFTRKVSDLAQRRVLLDEKIPNEEKIFSLFEPHTELINRGKSPYPIEFGHRVLVIQDKVGFILKFYVMDHTTDEKVVVPIMKELQQRYGRKIKAASFDKGFYTPDNLIELGKIIPLVCLPKKGKLKEKDKQREGAPEFGEIRKWHSGIESAIHALGVGNGLALCRDKNEKGYCRYVAFGVLGRNIQVLGSILIKKINEEQKRRAKAA